MTADAEPNDPYNDTTEHNNQDTIEHEESNHDADSNACVDEIPEDNPEDEPIRWVDHIKRATHTQSGRHVGSKRNLFFLDD